MFCITLDGNDTHSDHKVKENNNNKMEEKAVAIYSYENWK